MSIDDRTEMEARLTRTLDAVARLVPDEPERAEAPTEEVARLAPARETRQRRDRSRPAGRGPQRRPARRPRTVVVACAVGLVLVLAGATLLLARGDDSSDRVRIDSPAASAPKRTPTTTVDPSLVEVPNVVGRPLADAQSTLAAAGFSVLLRYVTSPQPSGTVVAQDPATGRAPRATTLTLDVSSGS